MKARYRYSSKGEAGQSLTEFVIVLPLFLILTFASLGLARLVYIRWSLEERSRFNAFSAAHGADGTSLFNQHLAFRPKAPNYMKGVSFTSNQRTFGDLLSLIDSSDIDGPSRGDGIPPVTLSPRQRSGAAARQAGRSIFWNMVYSGELHAKRNLSDAIRQMNQVAAVEIPAIEKLNPYVGTGSAMNYFDRKLLLAQFQSTASPTQILDLDRSFQQDLLDSALNTDYLNLRDNYTLAKLAGPRRSYVGAFQGAMRNVLASDSQLSSSLIDNSVLHVSSTVNGIGSALQTLPLHGLANSALTSNLFIVSDSWDIDRQDGTRWRDLGDWESTYRDSDEEGILRRRTMGLWMLPSNPAALLEPMTDLFPGELRSAVDAVNGPISSAITTIKELLSDNPLNIILRAVHKLPVIGSILDFELPEWPAVRPEAYPGSQEMRNDRLTGSRRDFKDYMNEQKNFQNRGR